MWEETCSKASSKYTARSGSAYNQLRKSELTFQKEHFDLGVVCIRGAAITKFSFATSSLHGSLSHVDDIIFHPQARQS